MDIKLQGKWLAFIWIWLALTLPIKTQGPGPQCTSIYPDDRLECGYPTISEEDCMRNPTCCWIPMLQKKHCFLRSGCMKAPEVRNKCIEAGETPTMEECMAEDCCFEEQSEPHCFYENGVQCSIDPDDRRNCGYNGIVQDTCEANINCCYGESNDELPCYFRKDFTPTEPSNCPVESSTQAGTPCSDDPSNFSNKERCWSFGCCFWDGQCYQQPDPTSPPATTEVTEPDTTKTASPTTPDTDQCAVDADESRNCGYNGILQETCEANINCCYEVRTNAYYCYFKKDYMPTEPSNCPVESSTQEGTPCSDDPSNTINKERCWSFGCCFWDGQCYEQPDPTSPPETTASPTTPEPDTTTTSPTTTVPTTTTTEDTTTTSTTTTVPTTTTTEDTTTTSPTTTVPTTTTEDTTTTSLTTTVPTTTTTKDTTTTSPTTTVSTTTTTEDTTATSPTTTESSTATTEDTTTASPTTPTPTPAATTTADEDTTTASPTTPEATTTADEDTTTASPTTPTPTPAATTTADEDTTTPSPTITTPVATTTANEDTPDTPDAVEIDYHISGEDFVGFIGSIEPHTDEGVLVEMTWYADDQLIDTDIIDGTLGDDVLELPSNPVFLINNPWIKVCARTFWEGTTEYSEKVCSEKIKIFAATPIDPAMPGHVPSVITLEEGEEKMVHYVLEGNPDMMCGPTNGPFQLKIMPTLLKAPKRSCGSIQVSMNQVAIIHGPEPQDGSCLQVMDADASVFNQTLSFNLMGLIDARDDPDTEVEIGIHVTKMNGGEVMCMVEAGTITVNVKDTSPPDEVAFASYPAIVKEFSGRWTTLNHEGVFKFVEDIEHGHEVHIMTKEVMIDGKRTAVVCATAVRALNDVIVIDKCGNEDDKLSLLTTFKANIKGEMTRGFLFFEESQDNYKLIFPHGAALTVRSGNVDDINVFDVAYFPSHLDKDNLRGLAGEFKTDPTGSPPDGPYDYEYWRVTSAENIFEQDGVPGPEHDWCQCNEEWPGVNCLDTAYERCNSKLRPITEDILLGKPLNPEMKEAWTDPGITAPVGPTEPDWPSNIITEDQARYQCKLAILYSDLGQKCGPMLPAEFSAMVDACVHTVGICDSYDPIPAMVEILKELCQEEVEQSPTYTPELKDILKYVCINDCGIGYCYDGVCRCTGSYTGPGCEIPPDGPPVVTAIEEGGICDPTVEHCETVTISGIFNPLFSYTCVITYIDILTKEPLQMEVTYPASDVSTGELTCPVPTDQSALVSIRDNHGRISSQKLPYLRFDKDCFTCSIIGTYDFHCMRQTHGCWIYNMCFKPGTHYGGHDKCLYCNPIENPTGWSRVDLTTHLNLTYFEITPSLAEECEEREGGPPMSTFILLVSLSVVLGILILLICCCICHRARAQCHSSLESDDSCCSDEGSSCTYGDSHTIYTGSKKPWGLFALRDNYWRQK